MSSLYQYQTSIHFISNLDFDYIETYVFQRSQPDKSTGTQYLVNEQGAFHHTSQKICTFTRKDPQIKQLVDILLTQVENVPSWVCSPVYRDAVVFYNAQGAIVATLNICLECEHMAIAPFSEINADEQAYRLMRSFLAEIGHGAG